MRGTLLLLLLLGIAVIGCSDEPAVRLNVGAQDSSLIGQEVTYAADDEFAALSENGAVKLGLTNERVYFEVSEALREHVDAEIAEGMDEESRIARSIESAVRRGVSSALSIDIAFRVAEIRDIDYRGGELVFDWEDPDDGRTLRNIELDGEPITRAFSAEDARAFVEAFRRVKGGESQAADTAGGASF